MPRLLLLVLVLVLGGSAACMLPEGIPRANPQRAELRCEGLVPCSAC